MRRILPLSAALALAPMPPAAAQDLIGDSVLDEAQVWSPDFETEARGTLATIEERSGLEFLLVSLPSLDNRTSEVVADEFIAQIRESMADKRGVAVLLLAPKEREFTFQMNAPTVEGERDPTAFSKEVERKLPAAVVPYFGKDDWDGGARAALAAILAEVSVAPGDTQ